MRAGGQPASKTNSIQIDRIISMGNGENNWNYATITWRTSVYGNKILLVSKANRIDWAQTTFKSSIDPRAEIKIILWINCDETKHVNINARHARKRTKHIYFDHFDAAHFRVNSKRDIIVLNNGSTCISSVFCVPFSEKIKWNKLYKTHTTKKKKLNERTLSSERTRCKMVFSTCKNSNSHTYTR